MTGPAPYYQDDLVTLWHGDCLNILPELPGNSVDAVVTDPPYALNFMGRSWDKFAGYVERNGSTRALGDDGGRHDEGYRNMRGREHEFQQWCQQWAAECLRILRPGGHLLAFGGTRTSHRLACAIEDAGFEIRDSIAWLYGSGFPKSLAVDKAIDRQRDDYPAVREVVMFLRQAVAASDAPRAVLDEALGGPAVMAHFLAPSQSNAGCPQWGQWLTLKNILRFGDGMDPEVWRLNGRKGTPGEAWDQREIVGTNANIERAARSLGGDIGFGAGRLNTDITAPATPEAAQWQGWGTALKPAHEPIIVARKPLGAGTVAANVLRWGTGALNVDAGRIEGRERTAYGLATAKRSKVATYGTPTESANFDSTKGRWPANVALDETQAAALDQMSGEAPPSTRTIRRGGHSGGMYGPERNEGDERGFADSGGASRFFLTVESDPLPPPVCVLHGMLSVCESANGAAAKPAIPSTARAAAPGSLQLPDGGSEDRSPEPASTAASSSPATDELTAAIAHLNVPAKNAASLVRSAASAVNLCGSCVTAIAQSAVLTLQGLPGLSPLGLASTHNSSVAILNRNLALVAEDLAKCDTTSTTTDLTTSLGCAVDAISTYITRASRHGSSGSDPPGPAIQPRMFYTAKASTDERITYQRAEVVGGGRVAHPT